MFEARIEFYTGICGTDGHVHEGEFIAKFPVSARKKTMLSISLD
jgi:hypothetical protein